MSPTEVVWASPVASHSCTFRLYMQLLPKQRWKRSATPECRCKFYPAHRTTGNTLRRYFKIL